MFRDEARAKITRELNRGVAARQAGLEGQARVCARRAAGAAIREFLELQDLPVPGPSAVDLLAGLPLLTEPGEVLEVEGPQIRKAAEHLLTRVDETFALPEDVDLLEQARWLAGALERALGPALSE